MTSIDFPNPENFDPCGPFDFEKLFQVDIDNIKPVYDIDSGVVYIDNFYKYPEQIYSWLNNQAKPLWKYNENLDTKNAIDYYDCRINTARNDDQVYWNEFLEYIMEIINNIWSNQSYEFDDFFEINCFKTININDTKLQHFPHLDLDDETGDDYPAGTHTIHPKEYYKNAWINCIVYLDKEEAGGTARYSGTAIDNNEHKNLMFNYVDNKNVKLYDVIPSKFNRCVLFQGISLHGAYIDNYKKYLDKWRYSQISFFRPDVSPIKQQEKFELNTEIRPIINVSSEYGPKGTK